MNAPAPVSHWAPHVIEFLAETLPRRRDIAGWDDKAMTAYQIGCNALVALGHAEPTQWGASPRIPPGPLNDFLRWDDMCIAVMWLARQERQLSFPQEHSPRPQKIGRFDQTVLKGATQLQPPPANIDAHGGVPAAHATPDVSEVLCKLHLVERGRWTDHAEPILWRLSPQRVEVDFATDPRLQAAAQQAADTVPRDIQNEVNRLVTITETDIASLIAQQAAAAAELRRTYGPNARIRMMQPDQARPRIVFQRCNEIDWLFYRRWRLPEGWLNLDQSAHALPIFHDPLATHMRRFVVGQLFPDRPEFAEQ